MISQQFQSFKLLGLPFMADIKQILSRMQFFKPLFIEFGIVFIVVLSEFPVFQASFHRASNNTNIISLVGHSNTFKPLFIEPETNSKVALEEALSFQASFHRVKFYKGCEYVVKGYLSSLFSSRVKILSFNEFFEKLSSLLVVLRYDTYIPEIGKEV